MENKIMPSKNWKSWSILVTLIIMIAFFAQAVIPALAAAMTITPGTIWNDTANHVIHAHGGGMIKVGSTYYWLGEDKTNGSPFQNIKCYSSTDLKNWTFVNNVLTMQSSGDLGPNRIVERPHVIYNASTSTYVMWMHIDNTSYADRRAGTATSSSVCGAYTYRGAVRPLGHDSRDDTVYVDGTAGYFLSEDATNQKLQLYRLSSDYLTVSSLVASFPWFESPAVVKVGGTYFLFGSHLTGWNTNDNQYTTATSLAGPWSSWRSFAPSGTNTCNSQTTNIVPVQGTSGTTYLLMADRWNPGNLADSRYVWEPLTLNGTTASITCHTSWNIDTVTGTWSVDNSPTPIPGAFPVAGTYYRFINRNSGKVAEVAGFSTADGGNVQQWSWTGTSSQQWSFVATDSGFYRVINRNSGKCLDVNAESTADGANVQQWTCSGGNNQQWSLTSLAGGYYRLTARHSGKVLDVVGNGTADGVNIDQWPWNNGNNQQWQIVP
jgi:hypothetical protein